MPETPYGMPAYVIERVMAKRGRLAVFDRFEPRKTADWNAAYDRFLKLL